MENDPEEINYYKILGISENATDKKIDKAYKKLALKFHPDKNLGNEAAAEMFRKVKEAQTFLLDTEKRAAYDKKRNSKLKHVQQLAERNRALGSARRKQREELERRERQARGEPVPEQDLTEEDRARLAAAARKRKYNMEVDRLRKEGQQKKFEASYEGISRASAAGFVSPSGLSSDLGPDNCENFSDRQIKIKWKTKKISHSEDTLCKLFRVYGDIKYIELDRSGKANSALLTFSAQVQAQDAAKAFSQSEDMKVVLVSEKKKKHWTPDDTKEQKIEPKPSLVNFKDMESITMMKMRQAAERQRIIKELEEENKDNQSASVKTPNEGLSTELFPQEPNRAAVQLSSVCSNDLEDSFLKTEKIVQFEDKDLSMWSKNNCSGSGQVQTNDATFASWASGTVNSHKEKKTQPIPLITNLNPQFALHFGSPYSNLSSASTLDIKNSTQVSISSFEQEIFSKMLKAKENKEKHAANVDPGLYEMDDKVS